MISIQDVEEVLGVDFEDKTLLQRALLHRSYLNEFPDYPLEDNERLEFLGDAVLDCITAEYLYNRFPEKREGELTNLRSALVRTEMLAYFARELGLNRFVLLGRGEEDGGGRDRNVILCNCFEAFVGALYLDKGHQFVRDYLNDMITPVVKEVLNSSERKDPKSALQELSQGYLQITPHYRTVEEKGPDHAKTFVVEALIGEKVYGSGEGHSKQTAAKVAAALALQNLKKELLGSESAD
jgi:ribonuclease-3